MKMFRIAIISNKSYRGRRRTYWKALVLANNKEEALKKATEHNMPSYDDSHIDINETGTDVYTY